MKREPLRLILGGLQLVEFLGEFVSFQNALAKEDANDGFEGFGRRGRVSWGRRRARSVI
jgi:hypothetical protein